VNPLTDLMLAEFCFEFGIGASSLKQAPPRQAFATMACGGPFSKRRHPKSLSALQPAVAGQV
jgi:hypothetical protein